MLVDINLLPQKERDRPAFVIAAILLIIIAIISWTTLYFMAQSEMNEQSVLAAQSSHLAVEQAALRAELEEATGMNEEQQLKATVDWAESYQFDTIPLLKELVSLLPARGFFDQIQFSEPNTSTLMVQFDTTRAAAYYLAQLKSSELLASVTLDSVESEEFASEDEEELVAENALETPRYIATYTLEFVDERLPVLDEEGNVVEEVPAEETVEPAEPTTEEEVIEETETAPAETEGDSNE